MSDEPKGLYEVEIEIKVYCAARSRRGAESIAADLLRTGELEDEIENAWITACQVKNAQHITGDWAGARPYGGSDKTCAEWLEEWNKWNRTRPLTPKELEAAGQQRLPTQDAESTGA